MPQRSLSSGLREASSARALWRERGREGWLSCSGWLERGKAGSQPGPHAKLSLARNRGGRPRGPLLCPERLPLPPHGGGTAVLTDQEGQPAAHATLSCVGLLGQLTTPAVAEPLDYREVQKSQDSLKEASFLTNRSGRALSGR